MSRLGTPLSTGERKPPRMTFVVTRGWPRPRLA